MKYTTTKIKEQASQDIYNFPCNDTLFTAKNQGQDLKELFVLYEIIISISNGELDCFENTKTCKIVHGSQTLVSAVISCLRESYFACFRAGKLKTYS